MKTPLFARIFWLSALLLSNQGRMDAIEPANTNSAPQTRAVLTYIQSLETKQEKRILSGQFTDFGHGSNMRILEQIFERTGHWPALMGADYADFGRGGLTYEQPNKTAIAYWKQGGLVTISAHLYNPANPKGGGLRDKGVKMADLLMADTETNRRWMQELDILADGLLELKKSGVVVLWRPFHEMNGDWFWWGAQEPEDFIKVWRHMFQYFSETKKLDNLLWVYGPNHGEHTASYYPGDAYADIVGLDAYTDFIDPQHIKGGAELMAIRKPFGFSEFGPSSPKNPPGDFDFRRLMDGLQKNFPRTVFFKCWNARWSLASNLYVKELLDHPAIANREDLPASLFKKP